MTSYSPWTRFEAAPDQWCGSKSYRFATREEAQASLDEIASERPDLIETKIVELPWKPTEGRKGLPLGDLRRISWREHNRR